MLTKFEAAISIRLFAKNNTKNCTKADIRLRNTKYQLPVVLVFLEREVGASGVSCGVLVEL